MEKIVESAQIDELKTITEWAKDPRCPRKKMAIWAAIKNKSLRAFRPSGERKWVVYYSDLKKWLTGESNMEE